MAELANILVLGLPVLVLLLLVGLGLIFHTLATEGRSRSAAASQVVGVINLFMLLLVAALAWTAESRDQRWMFMIVAGAFALVGLLGLRVPRRFRD